MVKFTFSIFESELIFMKYLYLFLVLGFLSCGTDDPELPECMEPIFEQYKLEACKGSGDLTTWMFNGELVYCFLYGECLVDRGAEIYDANCNYLCFLGGITEISVCQGFDWDSNATLVETLYAH